MMRKLLGLLLTVLTLCVTAVCAGEGDTGILTQERALKLAAGQAAREIVIPEGSESIEAQAFAGTGLTQATLPRSLKHIADDAFDASVSFLVYQGSTAEVWAERAGRAYTVIGDGQDDIPEGLEYEPDGEDERHRLIITGYTGEAAALYLPDQINDAEIYSIAAGAFEDNATLSSVRFPAHLEKIGENAFRGTQITSVVLPGTLSSIGGYAFANCHSLTKLVLPGNLTASQFSAFINCDSLQEVTMGVDFQYGGNGFRDCGSVETIHYLPGASAEYRLQVGNSDNYLEYQSRRTLRTVDFGEGITDIGAAAFVNSKYENENDCFVLAAIRLPSTLKTIGDAAFSGLPRLTEVNLPAGVTSIGTEAFSHCKSLVPFEIPASVNQGDNIFEDCWTPDPGEGSEE